MVSSISYCVKELPGGSSWTWDVKVDGGAVTSGIATTKTSARVSAIRAARECRDAGVVVFGRAHREGRRRSDAGVMRRGPRRANDP
jgi:hypothetical protein